MESIEDSMVKLDRTIVRRTYRLSREDNMVKLDRTNLEHVYKLTLNKIIPSIRWAVFWRLEFLPHMTLSYQQLLLCSGPNCASYNYELLP